MPVILAAGSSGGGSSLTVLLPILVLAAVGYFVLIRPQRNRQRQSQNMQRDLGPGVQVMTTAGLFATVVDVDDEAVTLEVSPGVHSRYIKAAIARVITPADDAVAADDAVGEDPSGADSEGEYAVDGVYDDDHSEDVEQVHTAADEVEAAHPQSADDVEDPTGVTGPTRRFRRPGRR